MKKYIPFLFMLIFFSCSKKNSTRETIDFNNNWKFHLGDIPEAKNESYDDASWKVLNVPHDWSISLAYQKENTASSTGFAPGGVGWYRKSFKLKKADHDKQILVQFDGIYNKSTVWINGHKLGFRPNGYATFSYDLSPYLYFDERENVLAVKVDHATYVDSRWYTGSGIYRKVQLIKKHPVHLAQWGVQITTPTISKNEATVQVKTSVEKNIDNPSEDISLHFSVQNSEGKEIVQKSVDISENGQNTTEITVPEPDLWDVENPELYLLKTKVLVNNKEVDFTTNRFGIRYFEFNADKGFILNGRQLKIKGVNLHHDAGAVGAAVPKAIWEYRVDKLKSIGVNAIRMSHNPHSVELMDVCDEKGILVMAEAFDEWMNPKAKSKVFLGDNKAPLEAARSYTEYFNEWAERDLKDLIRRDFNHPSVIMWSIGNEIEWTFPHYSQTYAEVNGKDKKYYQHEPVYDSLTIKKAFDKITEGKDLLEETSRKLSNWVKETDTTRPVTAGCVQPSIDLASGYAGNLDVVGFNYRAIEYDAAHRAYPNLKIIGSENWGAYSEWKNCIDRDFVAGIFCWTGFAYLGEAGPWPRKGLEISFFDYAGFKTPRGHFFECLWKTDPKIYMVTTPANESEFSYSQKKGWKFDIQLYKPPFWPELRNWEWYKCSPVWNYSDNENIVVQTYSNCEEAELFLNGKSLGKQKRAGFADDNIIKWLVPYQKGELKVVGYNKGEKAAEYSLNTPGKPAEIVLSASKTSLLADGYDVAVITAELKDANGNPANAEERVIEFEITGEGKNIGVDNGWERNVEPHKSNRITTHLGKAIVIVQSTETPGKIEIKAKSGAISSKSLLLNQ